MSVTITADFDKKLTDNTTQTRLHLLPCEIEYSGDAKVTEFFESSIRSHGESQNQCTASFRGRPLIGQKIAVPPGYTGIVMEEKKTDGEDRQLGMRKEFNKFMYWNLDQIPSEDDTIQRAMLWLDMAKVLHRPINDEDSQKSLVGK